MHKPTLSHTCKNCNAPIEGNYCAACGQKSTVSKITIKETFQEIINIFFSVNGPLVVTLKYLCINPGKVFREFIQGKRKTYYKPVPFFILMTVLYVLMSSVLNSDTINSEILKAITEDTEKLAYKAGEYMRNNITNFLFFFVFSIGISLKLLFRKYYSLAEYFAISFYLTGMYTLMVTLSMYLLNKLPVNLRSIPLLVMLVYFSYAVLSLLQQAKFKVLLRVIVAYMLAVFLFMLFGFGLSVLIILLNT